MDQSAPAAQGTFLMGCRASNKLVAPVADDCIASLLTISGLFVATHATVAVGMHIMVAICPAASFVCCKVVARGES